MPNHHETAVPRLLVVDDDPHTREMLAFALGLDGHDVLRATNGAEAVTAARDAVPDLILLDWMMPVMNGILAARTLRDDPLTGHVPIILLTARGTDADLLRGYESGVASYLTKPIDLDALRTEVDRFLPVGTAPDDPDRASDTAMPASERGEP